MSVRRKMPLYVFALVWLMNSIEIYARDIFELTVESEGITSSRNFSNIENFINQLDNAGLNELVPAYIPDQSAARAALSVRGLPAIAAYDSNSTTLNFTVDILGIDLDFTGNTRDESQDKFLDFLEGEGGAILTQLLKGFVANTPIDPVAGNPNSIMAQMASSDYAAGAVEVGIEDKETQVRRLLGLSVMAGNSEASGFSTTMVSLPINYIVPLNDPRYQFVIDAPLRYLDVEGASLYDGSLGLGFRFPVLERPSGPALRWSLMPMVRGGVIGTQDMGVVQSVYSGTVTSKAKFFFGDLGLSVNNMVGYYQTGTAGGDFSGDYDLTNTIFRNGIAFDGSLNFTVFSEPASWEVQVVDTRVTGDEWFIDHYNEVAVTFGTRRREDRMTWQALRVGVKYTFADEFDGLLLVLGYRF